MAKRVCKKPSENFLILIKEYKGSRQTVGGDLLPRGVIDKLNELILRVNEIAVVVDDWLEKEENEEKVGGIH